MRLAISCSAICNHSTYLRPLDFNLERFEWSGAVAFDQVCLLLLETLKPHVVSLIRKFKSDLDSIGCDRSTLTD